jgi:hypothetical protein
MTNYDQLPDIATAKLPAAYTVAKRALAECGKVDECKDWVDKAAVLGQGKSIKSIYPNSTLAR